MITRLLELISVGILGAAVAGTLAGSSYAIVSGAPASEKPLVHVGQVYQVFWCMQEGCVDYMQVTSVRADGWFEAIQCVPDPATRTIACDKRQSWTVNPRMAISLRPIANGAAAAD